METNITFIDEKGKLKPLEEIQKQVSDIYNLNKSIETETSVLDALLNPEQQVNSDEVLETFSFIERSFYLNSEITHDHASAFSEGIRFWNWVDETDNVPIEERVPIKIYIDTPGGDLDATFSIIDSISLSKTPVWTITIGSGDSGGFFIGVSGHKRIGYPNSSYLFHEGCCVGEGDAHKYLQLAEFYKKKLSRLKEIVIKNTKITEEQYKKYKKDDLWMSAKDAINYGVIDEIATQLY